ncbi:type II toxin-antitoxin system RelB/DinJ family antitoxin [Peptostreptococcus anaerobius]|uniref:type II toxin-antitoxin system RelB/DinJ family antitoxin n=1 Tax=Peptostreptococcus anaerobius TaxID=1261 RepID=UPI001D098135|nr:type II toxin-antitoxin system RelB/DinJ family antitoxin [Peptostreptococcus anaerobius]MCB6983023.1 type II toxin-antitoxin system RelB/DinJ family antitoxin [Peptostreptococcus anaerobius]MCQ5151141.1 type II toxin-antitoxin system RelB/DinJ family antitoxin [Peptostreptococcus anaerobius]
MARTSNIYVRVEPNIKEQAEEILEKLGIPMSNAVSIFLRQVVMQNGLPFDVKIPSRKPLALSDLTSEGFNMEMLKAHNDFENGKVYSLEEVESDLKRELGI